MSLESGPKQPTSPWKLAVAPPPEKWDDWTNLDPAAWPERVENHYAFIPTICFNGESACGLVAYLDKEQGSITKFEGNPVHPGSRGRTCAKGPATINQVHDAERILKPLKRKGKGKRGSGETRNAVNRDFVRRWVKRREYLDAHDGAKPRTIERFLEQLQESHARFTPGFVAEECATSRGRRGE